MLSERDLNQGLKCKSGNPGEKKKGHTSFVHIQLCLRGTDMENMSLRSCTYFLTACRFVTRDRVHNNMIVLFFVFQETEEQSRSTDGQRQEKGQNGGAGAAGPGAGA